MIESLMLRIPIPAFYFYENEDGKYQVVDGQQRLAMIQEFVQGKFHLSGMEFYLPTATGFGITYVLPIIVQALVASTLENSVLIVENPEAHLHPLSQSSLGKFLALVAWSGVQVLVETHSEHIIAAPFWRSNPIKQKAGYCRLPGNILLCLYVSIVKISLTKSVFGNCAVHPGKSNFQTGSISLPCSSYR